MKKEVLFIQTAVSMNYLSPTRLVQYFRDHSCTSVTEDVDKQLVAEGLLTPKQVEAVYAHIENAAFPPASQTEDQSISIETVSISLASGQLNIIVPKSSPLFPPDRENPAPNAAGDAHVASNSGIADRNTAIANGDGVVISPESLTLGDGDSAFACQPSPGNPPIGNSQADTMTKGKMAAGDKPRENAGPNFVRPFTSQADTISPMINLTKTSVHRLGIGCMFRHYQIQKELGRGGMGVVYKAWDTLLNRAVAIKIILPDRGVTENATKRFWQESKAMAQLHHPNIVEIYESGDIPCNYFVMEYVEGDTLANYIKDNVLKLREMAQCLQKVATAMQAAHQLGIVHRDLKPSNIMISTTNQMPKIMDFGLVKLSDSQALLSQPGDLLGTPAYMSPEQAQSKDVDDLTDIYALGGTLYHAMTNRPPFQGDNFAHILTQIFTEEPIEPRKLNPDIPIELEAICLKCLEKDKKKRYASASALAQDLQNFLENRPVVAKPPTKLLYIKKFIMRNLTACVTAMAVFMLIVSAIFLYIHAIRSEQAKTLAAKKLAEDNAILAKQERDKAVAANEAEQRQRKLAEDNAALAKQERDKAVAANEAEQRQRKLADEARQLAEAAKMEQQLSAQRARLRLARIAIAKAEESASGGYWRGCAVLAGTALEFLKNIPGTEAETARDKALGMIRTATFKYGLIWKKVVLEKPLSPQLQSYTDKLPQIIFSPKGDILSFVLHDPKIWLVSPDSGQIASTLTGHKKEVIALAWSKDGKILASGSKDNTVRLWDVDSQKPLRTFTGHGDWVNGVALSPDGKILASGSQDKTVRLWDVASGKLLKTITTHTDLVNSVSFHPDGKILASASFDMTVRLWNIPEATYIQLQTGRHSIFSADGKYLVTATSDNSNSMGIFELPSMKKIKSLIGHTGVVTSLSLSQNNTLVSSSGFIGKEKQLKVWNVEKGELLKDMAGNGTGFLSAAIHPDGKAIATIQGDGSVVLWEVSSSQPGYSKPIPRWAHAFFPNKTPPRTLPEFKMDKLGWLEPLLETFPQEVTEKFFEMRVGDTFVTEPAILSGQENFD